MKKTSNLLFLLLLFYGCQSPDLGMGLAQPFLPSEDLLHQGVVNKYYHYFTSHDNYDKTTDISYTLLKVEKPGQLIWKDYDAGFQLTRDRIYEMDGAEMKLKSELSIFRTDTVYSSIEKSTQINWETGVSDFEKTIVNFVAHRHWVVKNTSFKDTIINDIPARVFYRDYKVDIKSQRDTSVSEFTLIETYYSGFGPFKMEYENKRGFRESELVEQMLYAEFEKRANHGIKRVAFIDKENMMDSESDFSPCYSIPEIFDYYNGDPAAGMKGGKYELKKAIFPKIDKSKMYYESGYLTFRFVVNCEGKAGWFVLEQADLDFQKKVFHPELIKHLFEIIEPLEGWESAVIRNQKKDTYAYLTIKMKDGEIIELLP